MDEEKFQELFEQTWHEAQKLSLQMSNINTFAQLNGYELDWDKGTYTKKQN